MIGRRSFLAGSAALALAGRAAAEAMAAEAPRFSTINKRWQVTYDGALSVLAGNVRTLPYVSEPVLIEGAQYQGIWQECGPHEALVYRKWRPDVARNSHLTFFALQRADGQLPANNKLTETSFGQIQMVVPIAATAWELARATGDGELLEAAYRACSAWDAWLVRHRNTRGTGLVEGFCTCDTGHDNSPRWASMPNQCPNKDASRFAPVPGLPRLCPDLSATVHGGRVALAAIARAMGRDNEATRWNERADAIRRLILAKLWVPQDGAFYDLDATNRFVRVRGDVLTRVAGEHVVDQPTFDRMWERQLGNPAAFWAPFPLPSIALDDSSFVRPIPGNSWGGASQALTALRAPRWMDHYGRSAELGHLMDRWCEAIMRDGSFRQQIDPLTGVFTQADSPGYSPCALAMVDFTWRLIGVVEEADSLHWNIRPDHQAAQDSRLALPTDAGPVATVTYAGESAELRLGNRTIATMTGSARLVTDKAGRPQKLVGIAKERRRVTLRCPGQPARTAVLEPNSVVPLIW